MGDSHYTATDDRQTNNTLQPCYTTNNTWSHRRRYITSPETHAITFLLEHADTLLCPSKNSDPLGKRDEVLFYLMKRKHRSQKGHNWIDEELSLVCYLRNIRHWRFTLASLRWPPGARESWWWRRSRLHQACSGRMRYPWIPWKHGPRIYLLRIRTSPHTPSGAIPIFELYVWPKLDTYYDGSSLLLNFLIKNFILESIHFDP